MSGYPPPYPPPGPPPGHDWKYQRRILKDQARAQRDMIRAQRDAYRAQYRAMRRGSIVGPLLIVAIGIVFLLVQTGHLRSYSLWAWYGRWWPLLLVGVGVVLLVEWAFDRSAAQREGTIPYARHRVGGGVVFLLIFLGITGAIWGSFSGLHRDFFNHGFNLNPDNLDEFFGDKHESDETLDQAFPANSALNVNNPRGDVTISGTSDDNQIHIAVHKQVFTRSDSDADNRAKELSPRIDTSPNGSFGSTLNINVPSLEGTLADLVITVPATAPVTVTANHGDIHVNSVKAPVSVTANHGDIELSAITGTVTARINNGSSSFAAHSITGNVSLTGHGRDLTLSDINGAVNINGELFGDTHLERIRDAVKFHTSRTDFQLARLDGEVEISANSDLTGSQALGPVTLATRSRNITLEHVAGDLSVSNSNGSVDLITAPPLGNVTVENRNGSVSVTVPDQAAFTVQAQTRNGDAENDFSLPTEEDHNRKNFAGTVGKGGALIRISTSEGDIALRKANLPPLPPLPPIPPPISIKSPDGSSVIVNKDGTRIVSGPAGNSVYAAKDGTRLITSPDGTIVYTGKDGTHYNSSPDGTKIYAGSNGVRITATPDGRIVAIGAGGKVLSDSEARDQLNHAEDLVHKATEQEQREKTTNTNH
jgi:DUF4097 and DUF4098 domain-containing protein YvlB